MRLRCLCVGVLCAVVLGCTREPASTEPASTEPASTEPASTEPATTKPASTEPASTEPAGTEPATTKPASTGPVTIVVSQEQMAAIKALPGDVVCITSAKNPITSLEGVGDDEFASWPTSPSIPQKLMAAFGRKDTIVGLHIMAAGHEEADFNKNANQRLFITHEPYTGDLLKRGGVRIQFKTQ